MKNLNLKNYAKPNIKENSIYTQTKQSSETTLNIFNEIRNSCVSQELMENKVRNKNISVHSQIGSNKFCKNIPTSEKIKYSCQYNGETQTHFLDKYTLGKTLYQKENCQVVVCYENHSNIARVAKILKCSNNINEDLTSEIQINYQLFNFPHKNIISLIEVFRDRDQAILVYEYLQGGTLFDFLKKKNFRLTNQETKIIMKQILKGLKHLHNLNILHRDIKLDNIMFGEENNIKSLKIIDFGCATFSDNNKRKQIKCGTPGYAAPEIYQSKYYDFTCDIYSLGGIFHILLTGTRIFNFKFLILKINILQMDQSIVLKQQNFLNQCQTSNLIDHLHQSVYKTNFLKKKQNNMISHLNFHRKWLAWNSLPLKILSQRNEQMNEYIYINKQQFFFDPFKYLVYYKIYLI